MGSLVSASHDQTLRMWDAADGEPIAVLRGHAGFVWSVAFSPDGMLIASSSEDTAVRLWDTELIGPMAHSAGIRAMSTILPSVPMGPGWPRPGGTTRRGSGMWRPAGRPAGSRHDPTTGGLTGPLKFDSACIVSLAFSPDGRRLATVSRDNRIYVWDVAAGTPSVC